MKKKNEINEELAYSVEILECEIWKFMTELWTGSFSFAVIRFQVPRMGVLIWKYYDEEL